MTLNSTLKTSHHPGSAAQSFPPRSVIPCQKPWVPSFRRLNKKLREHRRKTELLPLTSRRCTVPPYPVAWQKRRYSGTAAYDAPTMAQATPTRYTRVFCDLLSLAAAAETPAADEEYSRGAPAHGDNRAPEGAAVAGEHLNRKGKPARSDEGENRICERWRLRRRRFLAAAAEGLGRGGGISWRG